MIRTNILDSEPFDLSKANKASYFIISHGLKSTAKKTTSRLIEMKHDSLRIDMHTKFGLGKKYCEKRRESFTCIQKEKCIRTVLILKYAANA